MVFLGMLDDKQYEKELMAEIEATEERLQLYKQNEEDLAIQELRDYEECKLTLELLTIYLEDFKKEGKRVGWIY